MLKKQIVPSFNSGHRVAVKGLGQGNQSDGGLSKETTPTYSICSFNLLSS